MRKILSIFLSATLLMSCVKENPAPVLPEKYVVKYTFVNEGDANVRGTVLWTNTYFPQESSICFFDQAFSRVAPFDTLVKSIEGTYAYAAYPGCTTTMFIRIEFKQPIFSNYPEVDWYGEGRSDRRYYYIPQNVIGKAEDATVVFHWPSDTLKWTEVPFSVQRTRFRP